jgi:hypothetical protein
MNTNTHGGFDGIPNLRDAKRLWILAGGTLSHPRRTGEILFRHPMVGSVRVNNRRKDSPRELVARLRRLQELSVCHGAA